VTAPSPVRLAWLDALRGYAALVVVFFHLSPQILGNERHLAVIRYIDLGKYGVLLFFLVSGYVIPMSLERHGSLRRFWIGRLCRIYPAYLATIGVVAVLAVTGLLSWQASLRAETVTGVLSHVTMTPDLLGLRGAVRVFWTLSYEMTFYLVVAGLFAWRLHRHSHWWAAGLALVALLAGGRLPDDLFGGTFADRRLLAGVLLIVVALTVTAYLKRRLVRVAGAAGIAVLIIPAVNGHATRNSTVIASWQGLLLLAVMFAGTVVYRAQHGQIRRGAAVASLSVVTLSVIVAHRINGVAPRTWVVTVAAVAGTFLLAYGLRQRDVPIVWTWLGQISYSLYLLHAVILLVLSRLVPGLGTQPPVIRLVAGLLYVTAALTAAWFSYRMVELPGQALGRRLTARGVPAARVATQRAASGTGRGENARRCV
jgi:peptidoglycan/LPS O-acetylase OafA/YrhL